MRYRSYAIRDPLLYSTQTDVCSLKGVGYSYVLRILKYIARLYYVRKCQSYHSIICRITKLQKQDQHFRKSFKSR